MLTSIPPRPLHAIRTAADAVAKAALAVRDLADLGLAMLCPCGTCHRSQVARWLYGDEDAA